jgi:uncharacterized membrane protein YhiD involved in acid resistance
MGGIGFIGAGVILRDPKARTVEGLATAANSVAYGWAGDSMRLP